MRRLLGQAIYHLHWAPSVFWSATLHEIEAAMEAANTTETTDSEKPSPDFIALQNAHLEKERMKGDP